MVKRYDSGRLNRAKITSQGYLRARAIATRTGVFTYHFADGSTRRELRLPEEVFHPDSIETLQNIPVTLNHPDEMLTAENTHKYAVGYTGDHVDTIENRLLECTVTITRKDAIEAIQRGQDQVSCGYHCELDMSSGEWNGEHYDAIQRKIRHNHFAAVERGRAGPEAKIRLDADAAVMSEEPPTHEEENTMKIKIGNTEVEVSDAAGVLISQQLKQDADTIAAVTAKYTAEKSEREKVQGKLDSTQESLSAKEKELKEHKDNAPDRSALRKMFKQRLELESLAKKVCEEEIVKKLDAMDDLDIKKAVIVAERPEAKLDGKSVDYINGRFEDIEEQVKARRDEDEDDEREDNDDDDNREQFSKAVTGAKKGGAHDKLDANDAREKAREEAAKLWQKPLTMTRKRSGAQA